MTSASSSNGAMWQHGPKISSRITHELSGKPVQIVGSIHAPSFNSPAISGTPPPVTTTAPSARLPPPPPLHPPRHIGYATAGHDHRAVRPRLLVIRQHLGAMRLRDQRTERGAFRT